MLAMYADGMSVADIAAKFGWSSPSAVYEKFKDYPQDYEDAKKLLAQRRIAKYRRVGALGVDISLKTLEYYQEILTSDEYSEEEKQKVRDKIKDISAIAETAERRADLSEDKPTEHINHSGNSGLKVILTSESEDE
jgi:hypothetical protein